MSFNIKVRELNLEEKVLLKIIDEMCAAVGMDIDAGEHLRKLSIPGVKARISEIQSPMINLVGMAELTESNLDDGIQAVVDTYRNEGKIFGWLVGPTSQPANLGEKLLDAGLIKLEDECMYGMVLRDLNHSIVVNPKIRVEKAGFEEVYANVSMLAKAYGFGMTEEAALAIINFYNMIGASMYLAYPEGQAEPVAFSSFLLDDSGEVVLLGGAATVEEYRGQGIYSSMVAKRLEDAKKLGCTTAIIQAVKGTSAPICANLGFESVCEIDFYADMTSVQKAV